MVGGPRPTLMLPAALATLALVWAAMLWLGGTGTDRLVLDALYDAGALLGRDVVGAATHLGAYPVLVGLTLLGLVALLARGERQRALLLTGLATIGPLFVELQKNWFGRLRPHDQEHLVMVQSYSFPSGHSANSLLIWLGLTLLVVENPRARPFAIACALLIAGAVGLSRPMLGVHWPSDVVGGWALALFMLLLLSRLAGVPLARAGTSNQHDHSSTEVE
jgi:undecaprenyl-diphosphatase